MNNIGIDVSSYQGVIDWHKVKKDIVEFAILKVIRKDLNPDKQFENNWKGCTDAGMHIHGVYNYTYATTLAKAVSDAKKVLQILNGRKVRVYLDVEDACMKKLGSYLIDIINAYGEVIKGAGLEFGVYTGLSFYNSYIKPYKGLKHPLWIAKYGKNTGELIEANKPDVPGMVGWQFTSKAKVSGINGDVDMNVWYEYNDMESEDNMGKYASKVVEQAAAWIGKKESDGTHKDIINLYNSHRPLARGYAVKYTDSWCATFVSAVAIKLGYFDIIPTECSCQKMIELFKKIGCWRENEDYTPKAGDIIFYDWQDDGKGDNQGWSDHVGIVEKVSGGKITVIEGNYDDAVKRRSISVNGKYIRGYGVPKYDAEKVNQMLHSGYYDKYTGTSKQIDVVFKKIGVPDIYVGNKMKRKPLAMANGYTNYSGKASENLALIALAKEGKLKRV